MHFILLVFFFLFRLDSVVKFACGVLPLKRNEKQTYIYP